MSQDNQTEEATDQKLKDAIQRGNVAKSRDLSANVSMVGWSLVLTAGGAWFFNACLALVQGFTQADLSVPWEALWPDWSRRLALLAAGGIVVSVAIAIVFGTIPEMIQTRLQLATKKSYFSMASLNPVQGFKNLFGMKQLVAVPLSALRLCCMAWVAWYYMRQGFHSLNALWLADVPLQLAMLAHLAGRATLGMAMAILPFSLADWAWQKFTWKRGLRMSKEEVKREFKDAEGDPHMKGQRKQLHMESVR